MTDKTDVLAVLDEMALSVNKTISREHSDWHRRIVAARAAVAELIEAAHRAEVSFNTVRACYERNPANFALSMRELEQDVLPLRAALARVEDLS